MEIITLQNQKVLASNCYILLSDNSFSVIDPSVSYTDAIKACPKLEGLNAEYVLLTHGHIDHFWEIESYIKRGCKLLVSKEDSEIISRPEMNCSLFLGDRIYGYQGDFKLIYDNDELSLCGEKFSVLATPGHTAGSLSFMGEDVIFTGDTLFAGGSFGRYDLPTGNGADLMHSLKKLFALDEKLIVYSGHGEPTTIKKTKDSFYNRREI